MRRLYGLQYLRALAAIMVLLLHALRVTTFPLITLGVGVDLFFLLSGFLMVTITSDRTRPWSFLKARIIRIVPLYWALTLGVFIWLWSGVSISSPVPFAHFGNYAHTIPWRHVFESFAFIPSWHWTEPSVQPLLPQGWSLNFEMLFYGLFALALFLPRRIQLPALSVVFAAIVAIGLAFHVSSVALRTWTNPIILEFIAGCWIGYLWQYRLRFWPAVVAMLLLWIPLSILGTWEVGAPRSLLPFVAFWPCVGLLVFILHMERRPGGIPEWRALRILGDASYAIYLWQFFMFMAWDLGERRFSTPPWVYSFGVIVTGVAGGLAVHYLIERPLLALLGRRDFYRRGVPSPAVV